MESKGQPPSSRNQRKWSAEILSDPFSRPFSGVARPSSKSCLQSAGAQLPQLPDVPRACQVTPRCLGWSQKTVKWPETVQVYGQSTWGSFELELLSFLFGERHAQRSQIWQILSRVGIGVQSGDAISSVFFYWKIEITALRKPWLHSLDSRWFAWNVSSRMCLI